MVLQCNALQSLAHSILAQIIKEIRLKIDYSLLLFFSSSSFIPHCLLAIQSKKPASSGKPSSCKYRFGSLIDFSLHAKSQNQTRLAKKHWCGALLRIPNRAWRIDGTYASMLWSETFKPVLGDIQIHLGRMQSCKSKIPLSLILSLTLTTLLIYQEV